MSKEIYISTTPHETRLAIVEDEQLAEIYYERENEYTLAGSIYNGKVTRVLPGMQSSFVDIGLERDAFLYVTDFMEEAGDSADFEAADSGARKQQPQREANGEQQPREGGSREGRGGRGRRDRGERRDRPAPEAAAETESTVSFDEPIAPAPSEEVGTVDAAEEGTGSRRWRGRRGRRRGGRGARDEQPQAATAGAPESAEESEEDVIVEGGYLATMDAAEETVIEIDLGAESAPVEDAGRPRREDRGGRGGRGARGRDRERGGRERSGGGVRETVRPDDAPIFDNSYAGYDTPDELLAPAGEPIVLPGETIRKYRDPAEVAAEEAEAARNAPPRAEVLVVAAPTIEIVGWDGGAVLPGETLRPRGNGGDSRSSFDDRGSRNDRGGRNDRGRGDRNDRGSRNRNDRPAFQASAPADSFAQPEERTAPTPIASEEDFATALAPEEPTGLTEHPAHGVTPEQVEVAAEGEAGTIPGSQPEDANLSGESAAAHISVEVEAEAEYEPQEGASASTGDTSRRDLRRFEQQPEVVEHAELDQPEISDAAEAAIEAALPDFSEPQPVAEEQHEQRPTDAPEISPAAEAAIAAATPDQTTYDLHASVEDASAPEYNEPAESNFTSLQSNGEMLSMPGEYTPEEQHVTPSQDEIEPANPIAQEAAVQTTTVAHAETLPQPAFAGDTDEDAPSEIHAYGDGDFHEEEIDEDEEYEFETSSAASEEGDPEEYEEETLDGSTDMAAMLHDMVVDAPGAGDEEDFEESASAAGGFTEADFGGEPDEDEDAPAENAPAAGNGEQRSRREGGRRNDRNNRDRRGGRNSGDRGRSGGGGGQRRSVQATDLPAINELLKPGQEILVQIAKEPIAKKGARITSHIALPGRFLVFMPTVNHTGVSRKISSDEERRRLKSILLSEKGDAQGGFIVRTAADGASEEELRNDLRFLIHLWNDIKMRSESSKSPALIYHDLSLIERILRDQVTDNFSAIWVDTEAEYERVLRFLQRFQPSLVRRVKLYTKETPLFEHFGVTQEIDKALKAKVWLKSGGSIVINQTEALVAIDINTGKYVGKTARLEDTIVKTNLDAIPEIVRQIRLRDLGGIIVIDFIDMDERKNRAKVLQALEDAMRTDRAPSKILPFNDFGLVIMTRKRVKQSLERTLCMPDPVTDGTGMIKSPITIANEIYVEMRKMHRHLEKQDVMLRVHPEVVKTLKLNGGKRLQELEEMTRKTILVKSDPSLSPEAFDIH